LNGSDSTDRRGALHAPALRDIGKKEEVSGNPLENPHMSYGKFLRFGCGTACSALLLTLLSSVVLCAIAASAESVPVNPRTNPDANPMIADSEINDGRGALYAPADPTVARIEELTKRILEKEIELERLSTRFRIETTLVSPWQQRRVFVYGETNASCTEGGILTALPVRYRLAHFKGEHVPDSWRAKLRDAARLQLVGQLFGAGGDVIELGLNFKHYLALRERSFNPAMYRSRIRALHVVLDNLLQERQHMLSQAGLLASDLKAAQAEAQLLYALRDLSLIEYSRALSSSRKFWAYQNTAFLVDFAKNMTGASASIITLAADHSHHPHLGGDSGLMQTLSGVITLVTPVVGRVTGNMSGLAARRVSSKELTNINVKSVDAYSKDKENFLVAINDKTESSSYLLGARKRAALYNQEEEILLGMHKLLVKQRKDAHGALVENIVFAGVVAPPRIANGTLGMISGWHYYDNLDRANKLYTGGNTAYLVGNSFNMFETGRVWVSSEMSDHRSKQIGMLPRQQFNDRLRRLDEMEKVLNR
jgi:hypothetical protein